MILSVPEIQFKLNNPNADLLAELKAAQIHDDRCAMHCEPEENANLIDNLPLFKAWVNTWLKDDKYEVWCALLNFPLKSVSITNGILDELKKIFEAEDRYIDYKFSNPSLKEDYQDYLKSINEPDFWPTIGFDAMKSRVNSFVVIDLAETQTGKPQPYFYLIKPTQVIDFQLKRDGNLEYLIFRGYDKSGGLFIYCFDDSNRRKFSNEKQGDIYPLISEVSHNDGFTPATRFWNTKYNKNKYFQVQNAMSGELGNIDWLLYTLISGRHHHLFTGYPFVSSYEQKCTYVDELGAACNDGRIEYMTQDNNVSYRECPKCKGARNVLGVGTWLFAPAPSSNDEPNLLPGIVLTPADIPSLEFMAKDYDSQISWLTYNMIGIPDEVQSMAINEKQVTSQFDSRMNVIYETIRNFEIVQKFVDDTIALERYGAQYASSIISYGKKVFLYSIAELEKFYSDAKTSGAPMYMLAEMRKQIMGAKYKNNPDQKQRMNVLAMLEPYVDMGIDKLAELNKTVDISDNLIKLKAGFERYIDRFEREYTDVASFMQFSPLKTKIEFIGSKLLDYVEEDNPEEEPTEADPALPPTGTN